MVDLTPIFQAVIGLLAAIITLKVIPWIKSKTTAQQQATLAMAVNTLVYGAEQIWGSGYGNEKLQFVIERLADSGYEVDLALIEATVREMNERYWPPKDAYAAELPDEPDDPIPPIHDVGLSGADGPLGPQGIGEPCAVK